MLQLTYVGRCSRLSCSTTSGSGQLVSQLVSQLIRQVGRSSIEKILFLKQSFIKQILFDYLEFLIKRLLLPCKSHIFICFVYLFCLYFAKKNDPETQYFFFLFQLIIFIIRIESTFKEYRTTVCILYEVYCRNNTIYGMHTLVRINHTLQNVLYWTYQFIMD